MENISIKRRWYDIDTTLSLAVDLLEKAEKSTQLECAEFIKRKGLDFGIHLEENLLEDSFNYVFKRWYDEDKEISDAFEYLKVMPFELQRETALALIEQLGADNAK